jgi:D-amino-acid dehydrogenase
MRVTVVGGGAVGLCVAEALSARGADTVVLESGRIGAGASAGNAGWITPSLAIPVPAPGVLSTAVRWLADRSSPLWIRPTLEPAMLRWLAAFAGNCRRSAYTRGLRALQLLAAEAGGAFDRLGERGARFERHDEPLLYPAFDHAELAMLRRLAADLAAAGAPGAIDELSGDELRALEPALGPEVVGGTVAAGEARVRPEGFTRAVRELLERRHVELREHAAVTSLIRRPAGWLVATPSGEQRSDAVVLANGAGVRRLLGGLGLTLPVVNATGCSRTFPKSAGAPHRALYLEGPRVAVSAFAGAVRISGGLGLGARRLDLPQRRLAAITAAAARALPRWHIPAEADDWAGMRSLSPDGLPYIGPVADGLHVATAHATLGITLAPRTAELLADLLLGGRDGPARRAADPGRALRGQAGPAPIA